MPTVLRSFPQANRSGTQQTPYVNLPDQFAEIQLTSQASDATHSDNANTIRFEILHADDINGANEKIIQVEDWQGGLTFSKTTQTFVPNAINETFGPIPAIGFVAIRAIFNRVINIGATLTGLP